MPQPADAAAARAQKATEPAATSDVTQTPSGEPARETSYQAHAVVPPAPGSLREEERIGSYGQPRWTAHRRFPTTRIYVRPAGEFAFEWWLEHKQNLSNLREARYRSQYEVEFGLGHRLQMDVYLQTEQLGHAGSFELNAEKLELRWALADWGVLPLNPTVYIEYVRQHNGPPKLEVKALAGDELARRVHFGINFVAEHELGADQINEYQVATGLSYTLVDEKFSLGGELKLETTDSAGSRFTLQAWEALLGPSVSWSPTPPMHVLFVTLLGNETVGSMHTPLLESTLVLGWEI
jgi:hypothetical protein